MPMNSFIEKLPIIALSCNVAQITTYLEAEYATNIIAKHEFVENDMQCTLYVLISRRILLGYNPKHCYSLLLYKTSAGCNLCYVDYGFSQLTPKKSCIIQSMEMVNQLPIPWWQGTSSLQLWRKFYCFIEPYIIQM